MSYISCKNCGCELEEDMPKCPNCKAINPPAPKKSSKKPIVITIAVLCIAVVCVLAVLLISGNSTTVLNPKNIKVYSVWNGSGTSIIGERAEIVATKEEVKALSSEEFNEFLENEIADSGYNWFTIDFGDGTGIQFAGCDIEIPSYGTITDEGMVNTIGFIKRHKSGNSVTFEYEPTA
jgi:hypothetical protein